MKTRLPGNFLLSPLITIMCTGCLGYSLDTPETVEVENPIPLSDHQFEADWGVPSRWACESQSASFSPLSKDYFLNAWGEPKQKIISVNGETWVYEESGRWCGLWLGYVIPIPLVLPVCETFDNVYFEGEVAVSAKSRRFTQSTAGVVFHPSALFFPVPVSVRPGKVTENRAKIRTYPDPKSTQENICGV
jgi:hypothetical protein